MAGIYGHLLTNETTSNFSLSENPINDVIKEGNLVLGRSVIDKLAQDRFFKTQNNVTICFEGVNLSEKVQSFSNFFDTYNRRGVSFINDLKGSFSGFIYDKNEGKIFVFTDHLATKSIFYYYSKEKGFLFSSELLAISKFFRKEKIQFTLNKDAVYMMALYGFILEDNTYLDEVKKLSHSSLLSYDLNTGNLHLERRHNFSNLVREISYSNAIERIEEMMVKSIRNSWKKSKEYSGNHLSLLSGGMDARTNVLIAKELGFSSISTITFGQSNSKDVKYARMIADGEGLKHYERFLDKPEYLKNNILKNYVIPNDGLIMYHSSAHTSSTIRGYNTKPYSLLHTGQIGDALFGSFSTSEYNFHANRGSIGYTGFISDISFLDKIESLPKILDKYQDRGLELFTYEQRIINATLMGDRSLNNIIDNISPFFDLDLINFCLSLPTRYKKNQIIYFDWLKAYHERVLDYPWDKIDAKPNNRLKIIYGKKIKKYLNGAKKYFNLGYDSMNPYHKWLTEDKTIINQMDLIVEKDLTGQIWDAELVSDLKSIYNKNIFEYRNKFAVLTAIMAVNLHFEE